MLALPLPWGSLVCWHALPLLSQGVVRRASVVIPSFSLRFPSNLTDTEFNKSLVYVPKLLTMLFLSL